MRLSPPNLFDKDNIYVADMTEHANLDETMEGLVDFGKPAAAANSTILAATAIIAAGVLTGPWTISTGYGRTVNVTATAAGTVTLYGRDYLNQVVTQTVSAINGTVATTKAFKVVDKIVSGTLAGNISLGPGPKLAMPFVISNVVAEYDDGALVAAPTLTAADVATPTATTGDPRGTVTPTGTLNGSLNVQMKCRFNADAVGGLYGQKQA